jgi:ADP-ribose pyrophosphatase
MEPWRLVGQRLGPVGFLTVQTQTFVTPDDRHTDWDVLIGDRTVAVVAITDDDRVVLAKQFRPGPGRVLLELPGGMVEEDEDVVEAAARELSEETGFVAADLALVGQTWLASYATHRRYAVLATGCRQVSRQHLDQDEFCEVVTMKLEEFLSHVRSGQLTDADIAWMCLDRISPWPHAEI